MRLLITAYAVRTDAFRELLDVAFPLAMYASASRDALVASLDAVDAYYVKYPDRQWGVDGPRNADTSTDELHWSARCSLDILVSKGIWQVRVRESLETGLLNTVLHAYGRALTSNPNWAPVHNQSTQIIMAQCTWLFPDQLRELIALQSALEVPDSDRLRAEYRRLGFRSRTDAELDAEIITLAGRWIPIVRLADFAIQSGLTYVAYAEPYDTD